MTPFEVTVLLVLMLFVVTNFSDIIKINVDGTYPRWYVTLVVTLTAAVVLSVASIILAQGVHK